MSCLCRVVQASSKSSLAAMSSIRSESIVFVELSEFVTSHLFNAFNSAVVNVLLLLEDVESLGILSEAGLKARLFDL